MKVKPVLNVAVVQTDIYWENVTANLASLEEKIAQITEPFDLLVLPEMFNTGFTMNSKLAEPMNFTTTRWMKQMAKQYNSLVLGSLSVKADGHLYNRLLGVFPDTTVQYVDKRHLFRLSSEPEIFSPGSTRLILEWQGWKICPMICYDLRFPVWSRNNNINPYDLLVYVANWPAVRSFAWSTLLKARAIENQCFVAGVNRVGSDANSLEYQGDSALLNFMGQELVALECQELIVVESLNYSDLTDFRNQVPFLMDADPFKLM